MPSSSSMLPTWTFHISVWGIWLHRRSNPQFKWHGQFKRARDRTFSMCIKASSSQSLYQRKQQHAWTSTRLHVSKRILSINRRNLHQNMTCFPDEMIQIVPLPYKQLDLKENFEQASFADCDATKTYLRATKLERCRVCVTFWNYPIGMKNDLPYTQNFWFRKDGNITPDYEILQIAQYIDIFFQLHSNEM